jgi:hypothetical protein
MYVYFYFLHVSGSHMLIIRRINCIKTTSGICHSIYMTVWFTTYTPDGHLYTVIYTRCTDTINSSNDGHMAARNVYRIEINIHKKKELCVKLVIYKECTEMHGQKNIKYLVTTFVKLKCPLQNKPYDKWVPVNTARRVLGLRMEERPPIWKVAANILNKQSRTDDTGWSSSLGGWARC